MARYDRVTKRRVLRKELKRAGFILARVRGSHHVWAHPSGVSVVWADAGSKDVPRQYVKHIRETIREVSNES